jgi:SsrA-binding protein
VFFPEKNSNYDILIQSMTIKIQNKSLSAIRNKKATFNFEVLDKFEGGLELTGFETKSIREGKAKLDGSFIISKGGELFLKNTEISPYQANNIPKGFESNRLIKILLKKAEILKLTQKLEKEKMTLIPLAIYPKASRLKIEFAVAKGKKKGDKRQAIKEREDNIDILRAIKGER